MSGTKYVYPSSVKEVRRFKWPNSILFEGREVFCSVKNPNFAEYILHGSFMNKKLILTKEQWLRHLDKHESY